MLPKLAGLSLIIINIMGGSRAKDQTGGYNLELAAQNQSFARALQQNDSQQNTPVGSISGDQDTVARNQSMNAVNLLNYSMASNAESGLLSPPPPQVRTPANR